MTSAPKQPKIPVYVIAGWLGSGKTSLLNHLLTQTEGLKIGVLVNDFGQINIDAALVEKQVDELVSLSNGCLCCTLSNELDDSLNKLAYEGSELDAIFVEASGVADPAQMAKLVLSSENRYLFFADLIYLIDAVNFHQLLAEKAYVVQMGLKMARLVLINKIDLVGPEEIALIESVVREIAPESVIWPISQGRINAKLLFDQTSDTQIQLRLGQVLNEVNHHHGEDVGHDEQHETRHVCGKNCPHDQQHVHEDYMSFTFMSQQPLDPLATTKLLNHLPKGVYRAKGWLNFGLKCPEHKIILQKVGHYHQLDARAWASDEIPDSSLVFIGPKFDRADLKQKLQACIDLNPNQVTPENVVDWRRFVA